MNYIIATTKDWNIKAFEKYSPSLQGKWYLITEKDKLTHSFVSEINPKYIFFPHWSWIVPEELTLNYNCVCFHMTDLPFGRGGSPLQNLIIRNLDSTKITALKMVKELDSGPIYLKKNLILKDKSAKEIFVEVSHLVYEMIEKIINERIIPTEQVGKVVYFERRTPKDSLISLDISYNQFYNLVRMLDAPTYPKAYLELENLKLLFSNIKKKNGKFIATVEIEELAK